MPTRRNFTGTLAAVFAFTASGALLVALPGCGEDTSPIQEEKPINDALKDSINFTKQRYSKKGGKR